MADDTVVYRVLINEDTGTRVDINEPQNIVTVDDQDPALVYVGISGVTTSHTSLLAVWGHPDTLSVRTGKEKFYFPIVATIIGVSVTVGTSPVGADIIVDVNNNDVSIFTDQANRPRIAPGEFLSGETTNIDITQIDVTDYLTVDIDQVGSSVSGADLTITVRYRL